MTKRIIALSALLMITVSSQAMALTRATEPTLKAVRNATRDTAKEVRELRNDVRAQSRLLIQALRLQTGEQSAYADKQIESMKRFEDASLQNQTDLVRQQIRAKAESGEFDPSPDACLLLDLFSAGSGGGGSKPQGTPIVQAAAQKQAAIAAGGAASAAAQMAALKTPVGDKPDGSKDVGFLLENPSVDLSDDATREALVGFILKMKDPIPPAPVPQSELNTPEGVQRAAILESRLNRESIVDENVSMVSNMSDTVMKGKGEELKKYTEGTPYNRPIGDDVSELQAIDARIVKQYSGGGADTTVQNGVILQNTHELLSVMARMQYMQLELERREVMTLSAILSKMIESDGDI